MPVEAIYECQIEAAAPDLVLTAPHRALRSLTSTSRLRTILKVVFQHFDFRDLGVNKSNTHDTLT